MTELEKALSGEQFSRRDAEVVAFQSRVKDLCFEFNTTIPSSPRRGEILKELVTDTTNMSSWSRVFSV